MDYPSRKILITAILTAAAVGGWFYFAKIYQPKPKTAAPKSLETLVFNEKALKDDDNDGLKNWEEALWQTDPNNPDTDGDGTPDGEEIKLKRDPKKPGPDDEIKAEVLDLEKTGKETDPAKINMTDEFSRMLLGNFFVAALQGQKPQNLENALFESVTSAADEIIKTDPYSLKDIKISSSTSKQAKLNYLEDVREKLAFYSEKAPGNELEIITDALTAGNEEKLKELNKYIEAYSGLTKDLLAMEAPEDYKEGHLNFINATENLKNSLILIQGFPQDSLKALMGMKIYVNQAERAIIIISDMEIMYRNL